MNSLSRQLQERLLYCIKNYIGKPLSTEVFSTAKTEWLFNMRYRQLKENLLFPAIMQGEIIIDLDVNNFLKTFWKVFKTVSLNTSWKHPKLKKLIC